MDRKSSWKTECPVVQTLERVGERWSILLLRELFRGAHRFDELQTSLGIAPNILSTRLTRLVDAGFVEKHLYQEHPPRHSYHLTQRGEDFIPVLFVLLEFGNKHFAPKGRRWPSCTKTPRRSPNPFSWTARRAMRSPATDSRSLPPPWRAGKRRRNIRSRHASLPAPGEQLSPRRRPSRSQCPGVGPTCVTRDSER